MKGFGRLSDIRPCGQRAAVCLPSLTYKNIGTLTRGHVWKHTRTHTHAHSLQAPVLLPPACCWNCFPPSSEPGKAGFIVLTYLCVKSDCSVLYLCLYSDGESRGRQRERGREGAGDEGSGDGGDGVGGGGGWGRGAGGMRVQEPTELDGWPVTSLHSRG